MRSTALHCAAIRLALRLRRDLTEVLDCYERGQPFYLYTGRVSPHPPAAARCS